MAKSWHIARRTFLRGVGASLALPCLEIMTGNRANAAASDPPTRLACVFQPNGVYPKAWDVQGEGRDYKMAQILEPLTDLKDDVIPISNLNNVGGGHAHMTAAFLTGKQINNLQNAVSLDQMVASKIGGDTPLRSVELGTEPPRQGGAGGVPISYANTVSWSSPTTRRSPEINPRVAFDRLFRNQANSPAARRAAGDRKSVLDLILEDARDLRRIASAPDQRKLDEYLESVRSVETQIDHALHPPARSWIPPTQPELVRPEDGIPIRRDKHLRMMIDLLVLALWTDTTRVSTLMTGHGFSRQNFSFLDGVNSDHHGMSHHKNQAQAVAEYTTVSRWYIEQFAYMLGRMKQIQEGSGTLLDHSVVLYGSGMKDGNGHVRNNLPILLAGRGSGKIQPGRPVAAKPNSPLADLHLTLAQRFGIEIDSFNGSSNGVIAGL